MSAKTWTDGLVQNWYLVLLMLGILAAAVVMASRGRDNDALVQAGQDGVAYAPNVDDVPDSRWQRTPRAESARAAIEEYKQQIVENPGSELAALNHSRIGALSYSTLRDYETAAIYYESLLQDFPDYNKNLSTVFANLAACYERMGDYEMEQQTYRRMLDRFPADSQEYLFARTRLGLAR